MKRIATGIFFVGVCILLLVLPALYNGFPVVFYDTGGYIERPFEAVLTPGRSIAYGVFLASLEGHAHWFPVAIAQAALCVWMIHLLARVHGLAHGLIGLAVIVAVLSALTSLPWFTSQLMPDVFAPVVAIILYLLAFRSDLLARWERAALVAVGAFAMAAHSSHLVLAGGLVAVICILALARTIHWRLPLLVLALGMVAVPAGNFLVAGQFRFTPGGTTFIFGRVLQDGIVARFLADHCPSERFKLCAYRTVLPKTGDDWIWGTESQFEALGGWAGAADEMRQIGLDSLRAYPLQHVQTALTSAFAQFVAIAAGEGVDRMKPEDLWHTRYAVERFEPGALPAYDSARQQHGDLSFVGLNRIYLPVAFGSMLLTAAAFAWSLLRHEVEHAEVCGFILLSLLGNAFICGVFSGPHARYQSRIVWLSTLCVLLTVHRLKLVAIARRRTLPPPSRVPERGDKPDP